MTTDSPRLRMFAGPNGSGKTTIKNDLRKPPEWFGVYINPDDLEETIQKTGKLALAPFDVQETTTDEVRAWFSSSPLLQMHDLHMAAAGIECEGGLLDFGSLTFNSYYASVLAGFLRRKLMGDSQSVSFETVMSSRDKVDFLREAQTKGFRTYLYYIATEDPAINVRRVRIRVAEGGHDVAESKIVSRYHRSLSLEGYPRLAAGRGSLFPAPRLTPKLDSQTTTFLA